MKYILLLFLGLISSHVFSQSGPLLHIGKEEKMTVTAGGILHADGITLSPTEDFSLSNTDLNRVSVSSAKLSNQISRVYQFSNPTASFTGNLKKDYLDSELSGLAEQNLQLFIFNTGQWFRQFSVNDAANNSLSSKVTNLSLGEISSAVFIPELLLTASSIVENSPIGAKVIKLGGTNENLAGEDFTYTLVSGTGSADNASFVIKDSEVQTNSALDFETKRSYSVRLRVTDGYGRFDEKILSISITDLNEAPTALVLSKANIYESNLINQNIGLLSTTDQDAGDTHTYSLVPGIGSTDNAAFNVNGNQIRASQVYAYSGKNSYSIRVQSTDKGGLSIEKVYTVSISEKPVITGTGNEQGSKIQIAASGSPKISKGFTSNLNVSGSDMVSFDWSPSASLNSAITSNPVAKPSQNQTYTVTVTNRFGSTTTLSITVEVMVDYNLVASNILSPNGDGENDRFMIENLSTYPINKLLIFDRAGRIIYSKNNYSNEWDGQYNGTPLSEDTYYYVITFDNGAGKTKGYISLVK
jgi:gliding motility-associated-like protein